MAEFPGRITKMFVGNPYLRQNGVYCLEVFKNGVKGVVCVDNFIPTLNQEPCFSTTKGNELWVLIIEKVWAKLHGDFVRIIAGLPHDTFRDLTGAPSY